MNYLVLDKETDELITVLTNPSAIDIDEFELANPDKYIIDENDLEDTDFNEEDIDFGDVLW